LYKSVASGKETEIVLKANSARNYKARLDKELSEMRSSEMWKAGAAVRSLRPERALEAKKKTAKRK
jgi:ketol-acid reductoisomerase